MKDEITKEKGCGGEFSGATRVDFSAAADTAVMRNDDVARACVCVRQHVCLCVHVNICICVRIHVASIRLYICGYMVVRV